MNLRKALTILCIILVSTLFISGIILVIQYNNASTNISSISYPPIENPNMNENSPVNILLVCEEDWVATDIFVLNYSPITNAANLLIIPNNTRTIDDNKISSIMGENGAMGMISYLRAHMLLNIKYYIKFDYTALRKIVDGLEKIPYTIPVDFVSSVSNLKAGTREFTGEEAVMLFRYSGPADGYYTKELLDFYKDKPGDPMVHTKMRADFIAMMISKKAKSDFITKIPEILISCGTRIETNLTEQNFTDLVKDAGKINIQNVTQYILAGKENYDFNGFFDFNGSIKEVDGERVDDIEVAAGSIFFSASLS